MYVFAGTPLGALAWSEHAAAATTKLIEPPTSQMSLSVSLSMEPEAPARNEPLGPEMKPIAVGAVTEVSAVMPMPVVLMPGCEMEPGIL